MYHLVNIPVMRDVTARDALLARIVADVAMGGLHDRSLRDLAAAVGTSHRLLLYHFGSRPGLVAAIVGFVEAAQRDVMTDLARQAQGPDDLVRRLWARLTAAELRPFVRLFFETVGHAGTTLDGELLTGSWLEQARDVTESLGIAFDPIDVRLGIAVVRGLLIDVVATGDIASATAALERFLDGWRHGSASR